MSSLRTNILLIGGKGKNGRRVAEKLQARGFKPVVTTRSRDTLQNNERYFDWTDSSTFRSALEGMTSVYIVHPDTSMPGADMQIQALIDEMSKSAVSKAVMLSGRGQSSVEQCEKILTNSPLDWSIIRSAWFNQNFSEGHFLHGVRAGEITFMADTVKEPFVDLEDLTDVVIECLLNQQHNGKIYEVTGEQLLTFEEAVNIIGQRLNRTIKYQFLNKSDYSQLLVNAGLDHDVAMHMSEAFSEILDGRNATPGNGVEQVLGRRPIKFVDFVRSHPF